MQGPQLPISQHIHSSKYRGEGEDFREAMNRIAGALSDSEDHFQAFRDILLEMRFMPAGRIQAAMGSTKIVTPYNCFVSGTIEDSFVAGHGSIMMRATEAASTMRMGGGIGYDFSTLRPKGDLIKKLNTRSSGPISFMEIFDAVCRCVQSAGHRRGAQMGIMRIDHPDIEDFIRCKQNTTRFRGFNLSVAVTDLFMTCLEQNKPFPLRFNGQVYREVNPAPLWDTLMRSTYDWADPGVIFIDAVNRKNNLRYCETIAATNPCGEQPLPPNGACLLGSINLVKYVRLPMPRLVGGDTVDQRLFDFNQLGLDIPHIIRAMDNVVDRATYPLYEQEKEAKSKRRMGIGVTGLANAIEAMVGRACYGDPVFLAWQNTILSAIAELAYDTSVNLAQEKGSFPLFDPDRYGEEGTFVSTLGGDVQGRIKRHGIRNSHLLSIAPTGTISLSADNVSSGVEPVFAHSFTRKIVEFDGDRVEEVEDYGLRVYGIRGRTSAEVTAEQHVAVLATAQRWVDSAVSKTCNVPHDIGWQEFKEIYRMAWLQGAKGCTTYRQGGKREGILEATDSPPQEVCYVDPVTGRKECA